MNIKQAVGPVCVVTAMIALVASWGQVRTNTEGLALIGNAEGYRRAPYRCPAGRLTALCRYLNDAYTTLNDGRISLRVVAVAKARAGLHILLTEAQKPRPLTRKTRVKT